MNARQIKIFILFVFILALVQFLAGCKTPEVRPDQAPQPSDPLVNQARLEFEGCSQRFAVGTLGCIKGQKVEIVTEFPGLISVGSGGAGCALRVDLQATPPRTVLPAPKQQEDSSCAVAIVYTPKYPTKQSRLPIRSLFGEVIFMPNADYTYLGSVAISTFESVQVTGLGAVRGAYVSRQFADPVLFNGDSFSFRPRESGTDLILVKIWDSNGLVRQVYYTANYYSPVAQALVPVLSRIRGQMLLSFPSAVTAVTFYGVVRFGLEYDISNYTGIVRAYTVQGRTVVMGIERGELKWIK